MNTGLSAISIGPVAAEILAQDGDADVAAVFERSCYVMTTYGYIAIGGEALGHGPLNVLLKAHLGPLDWIRLGVTREAKGAIAKGRLSIGEQCVVDVSGAAVWHPEPWPAPKRAAIAASLPAIRTLAAPLCPSEGLSRLVLEAKPERSDRTARAAAPTVMQLVQVLPGALRTGQAGADLVRPATLLLGLGPGLTPSGDDLLGGLFLALSALGHTALRDALWEALAPELDLLTVGISGAHLAAAADGLGAETVHRALAAIVTNDNATLAGHLATLRGIGHSSGFDTLAGIVLALDAALATEMLE